MNRQDRINQLASKFIMNRSDEELERRITKCVNRLYWDIAEIEIARRFAKKYDAILNPNNNDE